MDCDGVFHTASPVLAKSDSSSKACHICFKQITLSSVITILLHMHVHHPTSLFIQGIGSSCYFIVALEVKIIVQILVSFYGNASTVKLNCFRAIFMLQEETLVPAVNGTLNVLRSCKKNPFLKRVVLTSSSSAVRIRDDDQPNISLDETTWSSVPLCEKMQVIYGTIYSLHFFPHYRVIDLKNVAIPFYSSKAMVCPSEGICRESGMGIRQGEQHRPCDCPPIICDRAQFIP